MTFFETTQGERASWQRRAAAELAAILDTHRDLPVIALAVGPAGTNLVGHVNCLAPAATVREVFDTWRAALALDAPAQPTSGGRTILHDGRETNR